MDQANISIRKAALLDELSKLPKGNISQKLIRGKKRMYLQWRENDRQCSKYIKAAEEEATQQAVAHRRELEAALARLRCDDAGTVLAPESHFCTNIRLGKELSEACLPFAAYQKRDCIQALLEYTASGVVGKVCLVYGLRRTGKTTMLFQAIATLPQGQTAYIKIMPHNTMAELNKDLRTLSQTGIKYVFIDEITLMNDFIDSASLLSDVYALFGMKLILSGTDSLGFAISASEELYDRTIMIHTTFIPFREYARLLDIHDVDEYIRYGGTFRVGETDFDDPELNDDGISFRDDESTRRYIDTAIARNIQHSLACYKDGDHFMHLYPLYRSGELTGAINRIIEDMNHRFVLSVLTRDFKSHDLGSAMQIQRKLAAAQGTLSPLDQIDAAAVLNSLMHILDIRNSSRQTVKLTEDHVTEIKSYLELLDLIVFCPVQGIGTETPTENVLFVQPGMRFVQAEALVYSLMKEESFRQFPAIQRKAICDRILLEVKGRMLEDIVLLETIKKLPKHKKAFKLVFPVGEFDMVIQDTRSMTCEIYEIKHSDQIVKEQTRHLTDQEKCQKTEFEYGTITRKVVLYRGEATAVDGILYENVVKYLEALSGCCNL